MTDKKNDKSIAYSKFSLVELLSILILVGLLFIFIVPVNQARLSRKYVSEAISTIQFIGQKADDFKNNPENGYYPIDISQLNIDKQIASDYFKYSIVSDDSTIVAETKPAFGKEGAVLVYSLTGKQFRIGKGDNDKISSKYINENWLP
jgi:competence protein ComGC